MKGLEALAERLRTAAGSTLVAGHSNSTPGLVRLLGEDPARGPRRHRTATALPVVGVLDALRFPSFTAGPRWARDMGDPATAEQFQWLRAWSPLHRLKEGVCYPATLVTTAMNDDLVHPSQSYKFAAQLQAVQSCDRPTILRAYEVGGHRFWVDRKRRDTNADLLAFAAHHTGMELRAE